MPNNKSTEKRVRQNEQRRQKNKAYKTRIKTLRKKIKALVEEGNSNRAEEELKRLYGLCDRAAKKGAIHHNKAGRIKSRMTDRVNEIEGEEE